MQRVTRTLRRFAAAVVFIVAAVLAREWIDATGFFQSVHPAAAWALAGLPALAATCGLWWILTSIGSRGVLNADDLPPPERARHKDLVAHCRFLARYLKRLSRSGSLDEELKRLARQSAFDIREMVGHHPLLDDLHRAIEDAEQRVIPALHAQLDGRARVVTRERMSKIAADMLRPGSTAARPVAIFLHEVRLCAAVAGVYVPEASPAECWTVLRDTRRVIGHGGFVRVGDSIFDGISTARPPTGAVIGDLRRAAALFWRAECVAYASALRCKAIRRWEIGDCIAAMDAGCGDLLAETRDVLLRDALPRMKATLDQEVPKAGEGPQEAMSGLIRDVTQPFADAISRLKAGGLPESIRKTRRTGPAAASKV